MKTWLAVVAAAVLSVTAGPARAQVNVTVKPAETHQTMLGWGGATPGAPVADDLRDELVDVAVNDLGVTRLRLEIPGGNRRGDQRWERANDNADPETINWAAFNTASFDARVQRWVTPIQRAVTARGEPFNLYVSPSYFDGGSTGTAPAWLLQSPGEYAEHALALLLRLRDQHQITADYYCILNEAGNNNAWSPPVVLAMIKALGPRLAAAKLPTTIQFPESINPRVAMQYLQAAKDDPAVWTHVGLISYHLYGDLAPRPDLRDFAAARKLPTAQTEFMGLTINHLYDDLLLGGVSFWELYGFIGEGTGGTGKLVLDRSLRSFGRGPHYWPLRQVLHYVRPGAVRVGAESDDAALRVLAFVRDGRATAVLINQQAPAQKRTAKVGGLPAGDYSVALSVGRGAPRELGRQAVAAGGMMTMDLPADSVATIYPRPAADQPPCLLEWRATPSYLSSPKAAATLSAVAGDPEAAPLRFAWTIVSQPAGGTAALATPDRASCDVAGLAVAGEYVFAVTVADEAHTVRRLVRLPVYATNQPPRLLDLHNRIPVIVTLPQSTTNLRVGAMDLEGDPLTWQWSVARQPAGAAAALATPDKTSCAVSGLTIAGEYVFRITANDGRNEVADELTLTVEPANQPLQVTAAAATPPALTVPASETTLAVTATDLDGETLSHWWTLVSAPAAAKVALARPGAAQTAVSGLTEPGVYLFRVVVVDRGAAVSRDVRVPVSAPLQAGDPGASADPPAQRAQGSEVIARGVVTGTVAAKGPAWVEVKSASGQTARYIPPWRGGLPKDGGGPDAALVAQLAALKAGDRVRVQWSVDKHLRLDHLEVLPAAP